MSELKKVLIVDDDAMIHGLIVGALSSLPLQLFHAYDGAEGVQLYQEHQPTLILLDLDMPIMNGMQVLLHLEAKANKRCPIIVMSGGGSTAKQEQCLALGAQMYLGKPFQLTALINSIIYCLSDPQSNCSSSTVSAAGNTERQKKGIAGLPQLEMA
ncbi:MAG: response regulator [Desulfobulbaceae bacterium]|nr:response regulator [Desulfobulbaceae bacterium]